MARRFVGERILPLMLDADSQLEKNRFVTINRATNKCAYTGYGDKAEGVIRSRSNDDNYDTTVMPIDFADTTFFITMAGSVSVGSKIIPTKDGKGITPAYDVESMTLLDFPANPEEGDTYIVFGDDWLDATQDPDFTPAAGSIVQYDGSDWVELKDLEGSEGIAIYNKADGCYYISNGTAWKETAVAAISGGAGLAGSSVVCYNSKVRSVIEEDQIPSIFSHAGRIVAVGATTSANDASGTIEIEDGVFAAGDSVFATVKSSTAAAYVIKAVAVDSKITITLSGAGGAGTSVNYIVVRPR